MKIAGLDHIVLRTTRLEAMINFYCDFLGCEVERKTSEAIGLTQLRAGHALIDLVVVDSELGRIGGEAPNGTGNNLDHFCLQLEFISTDEIQAQLDQYGIEHDGFQKRYGAQGYGQSVYIKDPEGNTLELRSVQPG
ncbi:MAG: VOC family protein [Pseudomonadota bacterium]